MKTQSPIVQVAAGQALHPPGYYAPLAKTFVQDRFVLHQITRLKDVALYRKTKDGRYDGYEVIIIRNQEEYTIAGNTVSAREVYPNSEKWGSLGWTFKDLQSAQKKVTNLLRARK